MSKLDALLWMGTFLTVVIVSLDIGLLVGVVLSIACIFVRGMKPYSCLLGNVPKTELYLDVSRYKAAAELDGIKMFHFSGCLNFCTKSIFKSDLLNCIGKLATVQYLILDFSGLTYVDPSGVQFLKGLVEEFKTIGISTIFAGTPCKFFLEVKSWNFYLQKIFFIKGPCYEMMKKCGILNLGNEKLKFFLGVHDAVKFVQNAMIPNIVLISVSY